MERKNAADLREIKLLRHQIDYLTDELGPLKEPLAEALDLASINISAAIGTVRKVNDILLPKLWNSHGDDGKRHTAFTLITKLREKGVFSKSMAAHFDTIRLVGNEHIHQHKEASTIWDFQIVTLAALRIFHWYLCEYPGGRGLSSIFKESNLESPHDKVLEELEQDLYKALLNITTIMKTCDWSCNFPETYLDALRFDLITLRFQELASGDLEQVAMLRGAFHFGNHLSTWLQVCGAIPRTNMLEAVLPAVLQTYRRPAYRTVAFIEFMHDSDTEKICHDWISRQQGGTERIDMLNSALNDRLEEFIRGELPRAEAELAMAARKQVLELLAR